MKFANRVVAFASAVALAAPLAAQPQGATPVVVTTIVERNVPVSARLVGTVLADRSAVVAAEVSGPIVEFATREGAFLRRGEVICRIDAAVAELLLAEARGRTQAATAALEELEHGTRPEVLQRWRATVAEAEAVLARWKFEQERMRDLAQRGQSNEKERYDAEMEYAAAEQRLAQAKAQLEEATTGARAEVIARSRFEVAAETAVVQRLERDLTKTTIVAPFDGFLVEKRTEIGEWIVEGGPVAEMVAIETVRIRADLPEGAVPFAQPGASATIEVEALARTQSGAIARIIPRGMTAARTFPIEIDFANADHALLPGMFVWVHVPAGPTGKRLMVSKDAIVSQGPAKQVFVLRPGMGGAMFAMPTAVLTGLELDGEIEVSGAGLAAGDQVVVRANERLFGPTPVVPLAEPPATQAASR